MEDRGKGKVVMAGAIDELKEDAGFDWELNFAHLVLRLPTFEQSPTSRTIYEGTYCYQNVAIKEFDDYGDDREKFLQEVRVLRTVRHKNIVKFVGVCANTDNEKLYIVSEFMMKGYLLKSVSEKVLSTHEAIRIAIIVAKAIYYMHENNIFHGDLKTSHLLMDEGGAIKICDVGVALAGQAGRKADIFSFSIVLWELLAGKPPYDEKHHAPCEIAR